MFAYTLKPQIEKVVGLVDQFHKFCRDESVPETIERHFKLALDELVSNAIFYGNPDPDSLIRVSARVADQKLNLEIVDSGTPFDPFSRLHPDTTLSIEEREIGGLGIYLVKKLVDHASYQRVASQNVVRLNISLEKEPDPYHD